MKIHSSQASCELSELRNTQQDDEKGHFGDTERMSCRVLGDVMSCTQINTRHRVCCTYGCKSPNSTLITNGSNLTIGMKNRKAVLGSDGTKCP